MQSSCGLITKKILLQLGFEAHRAPNVASSWYGNCTITYKISKIISTEIFWTIFATLHFMMEQMSQLRLISYDVLPKCILGT